MPRGTTNARHSFDVADVRCDVVDYGLDGRAASSAGNRTRAIIAFTGDSALKAPPVNTAMRSSDGTR